MFNTLIVQPIFNLLVGIYALLPGHNFGLSLIFFTIVTRILLWPLVKKQLHHAKAMRELQPELKRIKKEAKGNRQREQLMMMELYRERQINPFAPLGLMIVQIPILLALFSGINRIVRDPQSIVDSAYPAIQNLSWMKELAGDISKFDVSFLGLFDLTKPGFSNGVIYLPAFLLVLASAVVQYYQSKQLTSNDKDARTLRQILREASDGKQAEQADINAAVGRSTRYFIPFLVFFFTIGLPSALSLYWLVGGLVALWQQSRILQGDQLSMEAVAQDAVTNEVIEGELIQKQTKRKKAKSTKKRRKK